MRFDHRGFKKFVLVSKILVRTLLFFLETNFGNFHSNENFRSSEESEVT